MAHWTNDMKNEVHKLMTGYNIFFTGVNKNNGTSTTRNNEKQYFDLIFGYCKDYKLYVVWNGYLHRDFDYVSIVGDRLKSYTDISFEYGDYNNNKKLGEKKVLIPKHCLKEFCNNCIEYLMPNSDDKSFKKTIWKWKETEEVIFDSENCMVERPKRLTALYERNPEFRKIVLENYEYKCAICHCDVEAVLEAHHIDCVSKNGSDNLSNGICLCRNHHKMVHSNLISLNMVDNTFDVDNSITKDVLTRWAIDSFNMHLIVPISSRK